MTSTQETAFNALREILRNVEGLRYYDVGEIVETDGLVLGPPALDLQHYSGLGKATSATFTVFIIVPQEPVNTVTTRLMAWVDPVATAIEAGYLDAVVLSATPATFSQRSGTELPCYSLTMEVSL